MPIRMAVRKNNDLRLRKMQLVLLHEDTNGVFLVWLASFGKPGFAAELISAGGGHRSGR